MIQPAQSIFKEYYSQQELVDRFARNPLEGLDVIIPVYHTNELWRANLVSIYREVPVRRLLISDGGCIDGSIDVVKAFPRVEVFDHHHFKTLGKCVAELIKQVTAEWFIYLHSDVYLPTGWFDEMKKHRANYDWFGCPMRITVLVDYLLHDPERPYAGSQIGRRAAFFPAIDRVEDDYVYRQEDFVFKRIVEDNGFKEGKVEGTFHYHQVMYRPSRGFDIAVERVDVKCRRSEQEKRRADVMQVLGIVKYLEPRTKWAVQDFITHAFLVVDEGYLTAEELLVFIRRHNPAWLEHFNEAVLRRRRLRGRLGAAKRWLASKLL